MTQHQFDPTTLLDALEETPNLDLVREMVRFLYQALIDAESTEQIGAERHERAITRTTRRNGSRSKKLTTKTGDVDLVIPKLRKGSYFPSFLERRRRIDQALHAVVMEAYVHGVSTRKVDDLVVALGADTGISKSEVSRICKALDEELDQFRTRDLSATTYPYVFLDATYIKGRIDGRVVSRAVVIATGVTKNGDREVLGISIGDSEDEAFWAAFLGSLRARGLSGVELVISDAHAGLKAAIAKIFIGAAWQRCRVHFMRNVLSRVRKVEAQMVAALIRTIFAQADKGAAEAQLDEIADRLEARFPEVASMLNDAKFDVLAFSSFPRAHWTKIWSTNSIERLNAEVKRRTRVVGIFPNDAAALRLITAVCVEAHEEWMVAEKRYMSEGSMALLHAKDDLGALDATAAITA
jgi:transposase-like protein